MACTVKGSIFGETWLMLPIIIHFEDFDKLSEVQMIDPQILNSHPDGDVYPQAPSFQLQPVPILVQSGNC